MKLGSILRGLVSVCLFVQGVWAAPITGTGGDPLTDPALSGGVQNGFETGPALGSYSSFSDGFVTYSGVGGNIRVDSQYAGQYNGRDAFYLQNDAGLTNGWRFDFANPVSAFAFNWGAASSTWILTAFDSSDSILETLNLPAYGGSNAGEFLGISASGISYATLTGSVVGDHVFVDNFTYRSSASVSSVPELDANAAALPVALGLTILALASDRRRRVAPAVTV